MFEHWTTCQAFLLPTAADLTAELEDQLEDAVEEDDAKDDYVEDVPVVVRLTKMIESGKEVAEHDECVGHDDGEALEEKSKETHQVDANEEEAPEDNIHARFNSNDDCL